MTRNTLVVVASLLLLGATSACGGGGKGPSRDADSDSGPLADAATKDSAVNPDDDADVVEPREDAGADASADAGHDGGGAGDAGLDAAPDASLDAQTDASLDAQTDASLDAQTDASLDAQTDAADATVGLDAADALVGSDASDAAQEASGPDAAIDAAQPDAGPTRVIFNVAPNLGRHAISPAVYGVNTVAAAQQIEAGVVLHGKEEGSGYNWEANATNMREGTEQRNVAFGSGAAGAVAADVISAAHGNGGMGLLTLPIGGYVAADSTGDDVLQTPNYLATRFKQNRAKKGAAFALTPDTSDGFVYQDEFVNWVKTQAGTTPVTFALDNEPALWELSHSAFLPTKASYDDVVNLGVEYAKAIKDVWSTAEVSGPVSYGWLEYLNLQGSPDAATKGSFLEYYLTQMAAASQTDGRRLLDYLSVHWYPEAQANGTRVIEDSVAPDVVSVRVQAPRSLWDSQYREPSWIQDTLTESIQLLPRLQSFIDQGYPDTKLAISAWTYGGGSHISGAVAAADALGIFGRDGVDLAVADLTLGTSTYTLAGFRAFLDYDGAGAKFGDTSVQARTNDSVASSVYASVHAGAGDKLVIIAINKRTLPLDMSLVIGGATTYASCDVYQLTQAGPSFAPASALSASATNTFDYTLPAMSVVVIVPKP